MRPAILFLIVGALAAQDRESPLIRVTVNLVQVDAIVTDRSGRVVSGLAPEDFEILQDGKPQRITRFSYISTQDGPARDNSRKGAPPAPASPVPPIAVTPEQVRRTIVVLVDDLALSFASMHYVRESIKQLAESLQPGDLVSILRTGAGSGALQSFTTDRQQLILRAEAMRWNSRSRTGPNSIKQLGGTMIEQDGEIPFEEIVERQEEDFLNGVNGLGSLGTLRWILGGLREMPGRKSILLISEGFRIQPSADQSAIRTQAELINPVQRLTEDARQAGVVIYTVDPRGLQYLEPTAADRVSPKQQDRLIAQRKQDFFETQASLQLIAESTGGKAFLNSNDLADSYRRVLDDQSGFYLLGYDPGDSTFNRKFHKIKVRVKRSGLQVRSRSGFFGMEDAEPAPAKTLTKEQQLVQALKSPFHTSAIPVKLTGLFVVDEQRNPGLHTLLHVGLDGVQFQPGEDGKQYASLNVLVAGFDGDGSTTNHSYDTFKVQLDPQKVIEARKRGVMFALRYPVQRPGAYQLRAVVRDEASGALGSGSQFLPAPDISKGKRMALSSLVLGELPKTDTQNFDRVALATRQFQPGSQLAYSVQVFNPVIGDSGKGNLRMRLRIFENGKPVYEGPESVVEPKPGKPQDTSFTASGGVRLGPNMKTGEYALQVTITDLGGKKPVRQTQWTDFRVVR